MCGKKVADKIVDKKYKWLIKWKNYSDSHNSWEPLTNLMNCKHLVEDFETARKPGNHEKINPSHPKKEELEALTLTDECTAESLNQNNLFDVEKILDKKLFYLVKWRGNRASKYEWLDEQQLRGSTNLIRDFEKLRNARKSMFLGNKFSSFSLIF